MRYDNNSLLHWVSYMCSPYIHIMQNIWTIPYLNFVTCVRLLTVVPGIYLSLFIQARNTFTCTIIDPRYKFYLILNPNLLHKVLVMFRKCNERIKTGSRQYQTIGIFQYVARFYPSNRSVSDIKDLHYFFLYVCSFSLPFVAVLVIVILGIFMPTSIAHVRTKMKAMFWDVYCTFPAYSWLL